MSGAIGVLALRSRISERLGELIAEHGIRPLGRRIGVAPTNLDRWGADARRWDRDALNELAKHDDLLRLLLMQQYAPPEITGESIRAEQTARETVGAFGHGIAGLMADLRDGRLTPAEAKRRLPNLRQIERQVRRLLADVEAKARSVARMLVVLLAVAGLGAAEPMPTGPATVGGLVGLAQALIRQHLYVPRNGLLDDAVVRDADGRAVSLAQLVEWAKRQPQWESFLAEARRVCAQRGGR